MRYALLCGAALALWACDDEGGEATPEVDARVEADAGLEPDARLEVDATPVDAAPVEDARVAVDAAPVEDALPPDAYEPDAYTAVALPEPGEGTAASKAAAFKLYYRERVERAALGFNRFGAYGDLDFATVIGNAFIEREGDRYEIVPGPKDNNLLGTSIWAVWHAYKIFRSRTLALTLIRLLNGLTFFEQVTGVPGLTSREVYPGWTLEIGAGGVTRTRGGQAAPSPLEAEAALRAEIQAAFFSEGSYRYRLDPEEFFATFSPLAQLEDYAITYSFRDLEGILRQSECCSSLVRTPDGYPWAGAYWGNHNSRDNLPDLVLGALAAMAAAEDEEGDEDVRAAARRAVEAVNRVGDEMRAAGNNLMTIDEYHDYGDLTVGGARRPHGEAEGQDLGSMATCAMAYLGHAISSEGLTRPAPHTPLPGAEVERLLGALGNIITCEIPEGPTTCRRLDQAYCGYRWETMEQMEIMGQPFFEFIAAREAANPGSLQPIIAKFQNDYDDVVEAMLSIVFYARIQGDAELEQLARRSMIGLTDLMRTFAPVAYPDDPPRADNQRYEAALFDAQAGLEPVVEDLAEFAKAEGQMRAAEGALSLPETLEAPPLLSDEEIKARVEARLGSRREIIIERYRAAYGDAPPIRRAGEGYEARGEPLEAAPWRAIERPRHQRHGGFALFQALPICDVNPAVLDCEWAVLGCARPDLDDSGGVDEADLALFEAARAALSEGCAAENGHCGGADLDRDGAVGPLDEAFINAARGCVR